MNGINGDAEHPILVTRNVHADGTYSLSLRVACPVRSEAVPLAVCRTCPRCSEIGCDAEGCETSVRCSSGESGLGSDVLSVGGALKKGALVVDDNTSIKDIVSLFVERGLRFAVVTERAGQVTGVVHESHLIPHLRQKMGIGAPDVALRWRLEAEEPASTLMSTPLCVHETTALRTAVMLMATRHAQELVVIDVDGSPVGTISDVEAMTALYRAHQSG